MPTFLITINQRNGGAHAPTALFAGRIRPETIGSEVCSLAPQPAHTAGTHSQGAVGPSQAWVACDKVAEQAQGRRSTPLLYKQAGGVGLWQDFFSCGI